MKRRSNAVWGALFALVVVAAAPEATAAGVIREKAVRFASGAEWAIVRGRLHGRDTIDHLVPARAGQALTVFFKAGDGAAYFNVLPPAGDEALFVGSGAARPSHFRAQLANGGDYRIRVYLMRSAARRHESTDYTLKIKLADGAPEAALDAPGFPTRLTRRGPLDETLSLAGIRFHVTCSDAGTTNTLRITPTGLAMNNDPVTHTINGRCTGAEVADLDGDRSPEVYVYVNSSDADAQGTLLAYAANRRKSLSEIHLPPLAEQADADRGYRGHDEFAVLEGRIGRRFPVYREGDVAGHASGGMRQLQYKLVAGEAGWRLKLDRVVDY